MPVCNKCGKEFYKLTTHARTHQQLCIQCITEDGCVRFRDNELVFINDRRGSIRVPLTVNMTVVLGDGETMEMRYPVLSVDISMSGICFTWDVCPVCHGRLEDADSEPDPGCVFRPFYARNPRRRELTLELQLSTYPLKTRAHVVHILRDEAYAIEYIGARFSCLANHERRILEKTIIKYGATAARVS